MNLDNLNKWLTLLANIGVIAGFIFLGVELRQNSETAELQAAQDYVNLSHELDFRIVDDNALATLLLSSPENRSPAESIQYGRWTFGMLRTWENGFYLHSKGVLDDELWLGQKALMADLLKRTKELRDYYRENSKYFSKGFIEYLDGLLKN